LMSSARYIASKRVPPGFANESRAI
jgi:hypothetical protein